MRVLNGIVRVGDFVENKISYVYEVGRVIEIREHENILILNNREIGNWVASPENCKVVEK